jgi:hypothetical protein
LEQLIDPVTRGDPESPLRWTCKSTHTLSAEMLALHGISLCDKTVAKLLRDHGYSLQAPNKSVEGTQHPDRNAQFEHINAKAQVCVRRGVPVISVDTKKKELIGNFKNGGREWQPKGKPDLVDVHDFPSDAVGKAIPYGVYDLAANDGFVSVGVDHDTPVFAVTSIEAWWKHVGVKRYPDTREIYITADAGGSNSHRRPVVEGRTPTACRRAQHRDPREPFPTRHQQVEQDRAPSVLVHLDELAWPPAAHLRDDHQLISNTTNRGGLVVHARLDRRRYPTGKKVSAKEFRALQVERDAFHW